MDRFVFCPEIARAKHHTATYKLITMPSDDGTVNFGLRKFRYYSDGEIIKLGKLNVPAAVAREFAFAILRETEGWQGE